MIDGQLGAVDSPFKKGEGLYEDWLRGFARMGGKLRKAREEK